MEQRIPTLSTPNTSTLKDVKQLKFKFQQIWFIHGIRMILKQAKISMWACLPQLGVGGYKDHQIRAETAAADGDHMWRKGSNLESFTKPLEEKEQMFYSTFFFFLLSLAFWSPDLFDSLKTNIAWQKDYRFQCQRNIVFQLFSFFGDLSQIF